MKVFSSSLLWKGLGGWRREMDVSDDRRERDVPSQKKGCKVLQAEDRKQGLRGKGWLGVPCHLDLRYLAFLVLRSLVWTRRYHGQCVLRIGGETLPYPPQSLAWLRTSGDERQEWAGRVGRPEHTQGLEEGAKEGISNYLPCGMIPQSKIL